MRRWSVVPQLLDQFTCLRSRIAWILQLCELLRSRFMALVVSAYAQVELDFGADHALDVALQVRTVVLTKMLRGQVDESGDRFAGPSKWSDLLFLDSFEVILLVDTKSFCEATPEGFPVRLQVRVWAELFVRVIVKDRFHCSKNTCLYI